MYRSHFAYPVICQWTFELFPLFGYCEWHCHEHWCTSMSPCFQFFWVLYPVVELWDHMVHLLCKVDFINQDQSLNTWWENFLFTSLLPHPHPTPGPPTDFISINVNSTLRCFRLKLWCHLGLLEFFYSSCLDNEQLPSAPSSLSRIESLLPSPNVAAGFRPPHLSSGL